MQRIRILTNPRRSMQRLGFLKTVVEQASMQPTNNLKTIGEKLIRTVSRKVRVKTTSIIMEHIKESLTEPKYKDPRSASKQTEGHSQDEPLVEMEIQDYYLSRTNLPSRRGKLVHDDWNRYPKLAVEFGLLRKGTYSLTNKGRLFLELVSNEERKAFNIGERELLGSKNPFCLSTSQRLFLLFTIIDTDGSLLQQLYRLLLGFSNSFGIAVAGNYLPNIYRMIAKEYSERVRSGDDYIRIQQLKDTADSIEAVGKNPSPGGKNAREHAITPRLEHFVDIGVLSKPNPFNYSYRITEATREFFEPLCTSEDIDVFLNQQFFDAANRSLKLNGVHEADSNSIIPMLQKAYFVLKSPVGYSPILELCLLASIFSLDQGGKYFEIAEAIQLIKRLQKEKPRLVTFNVDRWGVLNFVRFSNDLTWI